MQMLQLQSADAICCSPESVLPKLTGPHLQSLQDIAMVNIPALYTEEQEGLSFRFGRPKTTAQWKQLNALNDTHQTLTAEQSPHCPMIAWKTITDV